MVGLDSVDYEASCAYYCKGMKNLDSHGARPLNYLPLVAGLVRWTRRCLIGVHGVVDSA